MSCTPHLLLHLLTCHGSLSFAYRVRQRNFRPAQIALRLLLIAVPAPYLHLCKRLKSQLVQSHQVLPSRLLRCSLLTNGRPTTLPLLSRATPTQEAHRKHPSSSLTPVVVATRRTIPYNHLQHSMARQMACRRPSAVIRVGARSQRRCASILVALHNLRHPVSRVPRHRNSRPFTRRIRCLRVQGRCPRRPWVHPPRASFVVLLLHRTRSTSFRRVRDRQHPPRMASWPLARALLQLPAEPPVPWTTVMIPSKRCLQARRGDGLRDMIDTDFLVHQNPG